MIRASTQSIYLFFFLSGVVLFAVYVATVLFGGSFLRTQLRMTILEGEAALLQRTTQNEYNNSVESPFFSVLDFALDASELSGVVGIQIHDPVTENSENIPSTLIPEPITDRDLPAIKAGSPVITYLESFPLELLFSDAIPTQGIVDVPIIKVIIPLTDEEQKVFAAVTYWMDGEPIAERFEGMDQELRRLAFLALSVGGLLFFGTLGFTAFRITRLNETLRNQNHDLEQANRQLELAAKTSAVGTITSHLLHDLKNPLFALKNLLLRDPNPSEEAQSLVRRMEGKTQAVLSVIRQEGRQNSIPLAMQDLMNEWTRRIQPAADEKTILLQPMLEGHGHVPGKTANIALLILQNLGMNAIEASPSNSTLILKVTSTSSGWELNMIDAGAGLPEEILQNPFTPTHSNKANGSGIGLALSAELASKIGASLDIIKSDTNGSHFRLTLNRNSLIS